MILAPAFLTRNPIPFLVKLGKPVRHGPVSRFAKYLAQAGVSSL